MQLNKKYIQSIGNLFVLISLFFIIKKLQNYNINYSILLQFNNMIFIIGLSLIYGFLIWLCSFPWKRVIEILENSKLDWRISSKIATKANLMKYLPGNVFQFIGRNELAIICNLSHVSVATATVIDILENLAAVFFLSALFYYQGIIIGLEYYGYNVSQLLLLGMFLIIVLSILIWIFRNKIQKFLVVYKRLFNKHGFITILYNILFYCIHNILMSCMYIFIFVKITQAELLTSPFIVMGAFTLSWLIGFIVPGAPGGIGIRETVILLLLGHTLNEENVLLSIIIFRIVSTLGDLTGYGISQIFNNFVKRNRRHGSKYTFK